MGEAARTKRIHANVSHRIEGRIFNQNEFFRLLFVCRLFPIPVPRKPYLFFYFSRFFKNEDYTREEQWIFRTRERK